MHNFTDGHGPNAVSGGSAAVIHSETYCQKMLLAKYWLEADELSKAQNALILATLHKRMCKAIDVDPMSRRDFVELPRWLPQSKVWRAEA